MTKRRVSRAWGSVTQPDSQKRKPKLEMTTMHAASTAAAQQPQEHVYDEDDRYTRNLQPLGSA